MDEQRARDSDRAAAIKLVEAAWAVGEIVEADRDKRIEQLHLAQTLAEIQMLTHDIQSSAPEPPSPPYASLDQVVAASPRKGSKAVFLIPLAVVLVIAVASIGGIIAVVGSIGDGIDVEIGADDADVLSVAGYQDLLEAVEEETGSTIAFSAVLYPTYASLELPVDTTTQREEYWYWDGSDLTRSDSKNTSTFERTDLSRVDPAMIVDLIAQVQKLVEDPTTYYAIVRGPDADRALVWVYATNDYSETEYLGARRDGRITYDSTEH